MIEFAQPPNLRRLLAILIAVGVSVAPAQAQLTGAHPPVKSAPITFAEITSKLRISLPAIDYPSAATTLPALIRSGEYSLDYARRHLVPAMGGSVAVGDFDHDGHPDLYVVVPGGSNHLFRNRADGTFEEVTSKARVSGTGSDLAAAFADFDHSGHPSLFVAGLGGVTLYHNNGDGTFTDTTEKAGLKGKPGELATSALLFDAENDGFLDLLVTVYTDLSVPPAKSTFTFPNDFSGANSHLYRNRHDGTFLEITEAAGLSWNPGRTHKAVAADFNHNGRLDLLLLRDNKPPALYRNQGRSEFEDQTWDAGKEIWKYAYVDAQTSDFNHDGKIDVALWSTVGNEVLVNQGQGKFEQDESLPLVYAANRAFGFHGLVADLNRDGYDDLLTVDSKEDWHFIVNHAGRFEEAPITWSPALNAAKASGPNKGAQSIPAFASLTAVWLRNEGRPVLFGLTMDGRIAAFEEQPVRARNEPHPAQVK